MARYTIDGHPGRTIHLLLFTDVCNSREILQEGLSEPGFLNAALVSNPFPILAAAYKAVSGESRGALKTRTLHSELIFNYAASKHISESLKRYGISQDTTYILVAKFDASESELAHLRIRIQGKEIGIETLEARADVPLIQKGVPFLKMGTMWVGLGSYGFDAVLQAWSPRACKFHFRRCYHHKNIRT